MSSLSPRVRERVIERARKRCEYCQTQQQIVLSMQIDHIAPVSVGGSDELDNLCLACISCNQHKASFQTEIDPLTGEEYLLFNPRTQQWVEHFTWSKDMTLILGLTPTGRATVERMKMNLDEIVEARQIWVEAGWHPPED